MAFQENLADLKKRLADIPELSDEERNVLTSDVIITHVMPIMTAFVTENVTKVQEVKDKTGESLASLATNITNSPKDIPSLQGFIQDVSDGHYNAKWVEEIINTLQGHWFAGPVLAMIVGGIHAMTSVYNYASVSAEKTRQIANQDIRPFLLDLGSLMEEYFRHPNNYKFVIDQMKRMGIDDQKIDIFLSNQTNLLPLEMIRLLWNREEIDTSRLNDDLKKLRFKDDDLELIQVALKQYPSVSDFVLFSIREVFDTEFVQHAGLGADMPFEFIDEVKKLGLDENYAQMYWYSHWRPPSVTNTFDMLHRGIIDEDEVDTLLRINDIMPNYREKLTDIAYNVITRVDIRRLYQDGVIDYEEMVERYQRTGYNLADALLLADWTEIHYGEERKQRTRADIQKLYKLGSYTRLQAISKLQEIGYAEDIASEYITRIDLEESEKRKNNKVRIYKKGFINFVYSEGEVRNFMNLLGMKPTEIGDLIDEWKVDRDSKIKFLPLRDYKDMFVAGIINANDVRNELSMQGYQTEDIIRLITLWRP